MKCAQLYEKLKNNVKQIATQLNNKKSLPYNEVQIINSTKRMAKTCFKNRRSQITKQTNGNVRFNNIVKTSKRKQTLISKTMSSDDFLDKSSKD